MLQSPVMPGQINFRSIIQRWGPALILMLVIFGFSSLPSTQVPNLGTADFLFKKSAHATGYALLALAYLRGIGLSRRRSLVVAMLMAVLYASSDEFHQSYVAGRGASARDVLIDSTGALIGLCLYRLSLHPRLRMQSWAKSLSRLLSVPLSVV